MAPPNYQQMIQVNDVLNFMATPPRKATPLTVGDIERLAKAGVAIDFHKLENVQPDARGNDLDPWSQLVQDRWMMNPTTRQSEQEAFFRTRFCAAPYQEKVFVFVMMDGHAPALLEDDIHLFPSDSLMAKIHLMRKVAP